MQNHTRRRERVINGSHCNIEKNNSKKTQNKKRVKKHRSKNILKKLENVVERKYKCER